MADAIEPTAVYRPKEIAEKLDSGPGTVYTAIRKGDLPAAEINSRGDLRVLGRDALEWLERKKRRA